MRNDLAFRPVYLVDDNIHYLKSVDLDLRGFGHLVECFDSGDAFLAKWKPEHRGVVVLDRVMPESRFSGDHVGLRLINRRCLMPIIYNTGEPHLLEDIMKLAHPPRIIVLNKHEDTPDHAKLSAAISNALALESDMREAGERHNRLRQFVLAELTPAERDVWWEVLNGVPTKSIGNKSKVDPGTVSVHRENINKKTRLAKLYSSQDLDDLKALIKDTRGANDVGDLAALEFCFRVRWLDESLQKELTQLVGPGRKPISAALVLALGLSAPDYPNRRGKVRKTCDWLLRVWAPENLKQHDDAHADARRALRLIAGFADESEAGGSDLE